MKKVVWITLFVSIVVVNLAAWLVELATGFHIVMFFRLTLVMGITFITSIFVGAFLLVNKFEQEKPLTGYGHDTLQERHDNQANNPPPSGDNAD